MSNEEILRKIGKIETLVIENFLTHNKDRGLGGFGIHKTLKKGKGEKR